MEIVRYMTLAGLLFAIGFYGALTRRSFAGALLSLSISAAAIVLAFVTFNRLIQPAETNGYFFALFVILLSVVYGVFVAQFVRRVDARKTAPATQKHNFSEDAKNEAALHGATSSTTARMGFSRRGGDGFTGIVSFSESFAFQVAVLIVFVIGYLLMRLSIPAALAFVFGVGALSHILHRRKKAELEKAKPGKTKPGKARPSNANQSIINARTSKI